MRRIQPLHDEVSGGRTPRRDGDSDVTVSQRWHARILRVVRRTRDRDRDWRHGIRSRLGRNSLNLGFAWAPEYTPSERHERAEYVTADEPVPRKLVASTAYVVGSNSGSSR